MIAFYRAADQRREGTSSRAHRSSVCLLLRIDFDHSVRSHVVPSFWYSVAYLGLDGAWLLQPKGEKPLEFLLLSWS